MAGTPLDDDTLDTLFRDARTRYTWDATPVSEADLRALHDLVRLGPTSANTSPARYRFCSSGEARTRLAECVTANNKAKVLAAPVTAIIGFDMDFADRMPELFPHMDVRPWFADPVVARDTAFRNSSLQAGYFILAARALGWDTGPMSGFDKAAIDAAFWAGTAVETNLLVSIGKGTDEMLWPRLPRLSFEDAATIL
jgi:3-hydroxypropanoate dehydrogenase